MKPLLDNPKVSDDPVHRNNLYVLHERLGHNCLLSYLGIY